MLGVDCGRTTVATHKWDRSFRVVGMIVAALVALLTGANRDAYSQVSGVPGPSVTSVSPNSGPTTGGTLVTITGDNLARATAVLFGSAPATSFIVRSATSIAAISPAGSGTVDVTVTTLDDTSATSSADQFTYGLGSSTTVLSSSKSPSDFGQSVTFTAKVAGLSPTGTVTFFDNGTQIGAATLAAGMASLTTSSLAAGSHSISAKYSGDPNNASSTSREVQKVPEPDVPR
jgi:hypothetical protein